MFVMSPYDNRVAEDDAGGLKDRNFGGNRKVTDNVQKSEDYTKPSTERRANMTGETDEKIFNPVEETTKDVDDMNDLEARKREESRRAETSTVGADNQYRRPFDGDDKTYSEPDNRPADDHREDDGVVEPDPVGKHGKRNPFHFGESRKVRGDQNVAPDQQTR